MSRYELIEYSLQVFDANHGYTDEEAINIYVKGMKHRRRDLERELKLAFEDRSISWKDLLDNKEYRVYRANSEEEAKNYAKRILWDPIFENKKNAS